MGLLTGGIVAGVGALAGGAISGIGAAKAGNAQKDAAFAQIESAKELDRKARNDRERAYELATKAAIPSPDELNAVQGLLRKSEESLTSQLGQLKQYQGIIDAVDPAVKEAGKQTLELLQGHDAAVLGPLRDQRTRQKGALEEQLAARLGPGYKTTSAGIKALNDFDTATADTLNTAQFNAFNQVVSGAATLGGLEGNLISQQASGTANAYASSGNLEQAGLAGMQAIANRQQAAINPLIQMPTGAAGILNAQQNLTSVIGNQYAGQIATGQNIANAFGAVGQAATQQSTINQLLNAAQRGSPTVFNVGSSGGGTPSFASNQTIADAFK